MGKVEYTIEAPFSFTRKGIVVMKKKGIVVIGLLLSLIGCGNTPTTAKDNETTDELSKEELASIENDFNEYQPNFYIEYLNSEFDTESEIKEIEETIEFIKDDPSEIKSLCGKYKCVSGTKEGDLYKVHVEVVEGDNWSEVVFPPRDKIIFSASFLVREESSPVKTKVLFARGEKDKSFSGCFVFKPKDFNSSIILIVCSFAKKSKID